MEQIKKQLLTMGFSDAKVKRAFDSCPEAKTLEQFMEWMIAHEDELNSVDSVKPKTESTPAESVQTPVVSECVSTTQNGSNDTVKEPTDETATEMAGRKKITVEDAHRIITERKAKRAEEQRKKEIEDEKRRRFDGQKMAETRQELQDKERLRLALQIKREKMEAQSHKKSVLEQIARDREAMKERNKQQSATSSTDASPTKSVPTASKCQSTECKLALRWPDGSNIVHVFKAQEQLSAVKLFVQLKRGGSDSIEFVSPPNKKFSESMMNDTLETLGLCPASRLEVRFTRTHTID